MKINLVNLHEGLNELTFRTTVDDLCFDEEQEKLEIFLNEIELNVEIQKFSDKFLLKTHVTTVGHFTCDRCLDEFDQKLKTDFQIVYSKEVVDRFEDDYYRFISEKATEIDLTKDLRENLLLLIPLKSICKDDCLGLCHHCGVNLNQETCDCVEDTVDPRWEALKNLK